MHLHAIKHPINTKSKNSYKLQVYNKDGLNILESRFLKRNTRKHSGTGDQYLTMAWALSGAKGF